MAAEGGEAWPPKAAKHGRRRQRSMAAEGGEAWPPKIVQA
jgi:hypothetical protein